MKNESNKKKRILVSATKIFGEKGFQNATIAEIAKDAGVGDATIYQYFKNKEDLLLAIPIEVTKEIVPQINNQMMGIKGAFNKIRKFVWWFLNYFETNHAYASIILFELKTSKTLVSPELYEAGRNFYKTFIDIVKEGQGQGTIKKEIDPFLARSICIGAMEHIINRWLHQHRKYPLTQYADPLTDILISSFKKLEIDDKENTISTPDRSF